MKYCLLASRSTKEASEVPSMRENGAIPAGILLENVLLGYCLRSLREPKEA